MNIPSGSTDRYIYFVAVDATDLKTRETGLSTWTVYRSRNGAAAAAFTTPTINETDATNMPGVYELLLDEDTTIDSGHDSEEMVLHITHAGMAPVTRVVELYRPKITEGSTVTASDISAIKAKTDNLPSDPADASDIAASFSTVNSTLSTIAGYIDTEVAAIKAKTDNLPAAPAAVGDIPTAAAVADAVWDEAIAGHASAGSTGLALAAAGSAGDPWSTALPGAYGSGTAGNIIGNRVDAAVSTRATQTSVDTLAGYVDTEVAAIKAKTDNLPSDPADASDIAASFSTVNSTLSTIAGYIDTEVAAIKAKTDNLPSDPADASDIAASFSTVNSTLSTIAGYIDTEVAAIKAKTDNLPAAPAAVGDIPTAAAVADAVWDEAIAGHASAGSTGLALAAAGAAGDPWSTALPGAYGSGTAGNILGNRLDVAVSTRATSTGSGSGAYTITATVTDGTNPLQSATVRLVEGVNNFSAVTNASGEAVFALDAATYAVAVTKAGYSFAPTTRTVTGEEAGTLTTDLEMTAVALAAISTDARRVTFRKVLHGVARRKGLDPDTVLQPNEAAALTEYINEAYQFCWRFFEWPEAQTIEQATAADQLIAWVGATTYQLGDILGVSVNHPIKSKNPTPIEYEVGPEGLYLPLAYATSEVWLRYRRETPTFTHTLYSGTATYAVGDLIYFTDGDCYRCLATTTAGQSPTTHDTKWQRQDLLEILAPAVTQYALSEALREDGQHSTSLITDGTLEGLLMHEIDRLVLDQGQESTFRTSAGRR